MLKNHEIENMFGEHAVKREGRELIRTIREQGPVRSIQQSLDCVRVRYISTKMERALYAESRTVEFPVMFLREQDKDTNEIWPQPFQFDLKVEGARGVTRVQHTPDFLFIGEAGFCFEEWREEARLLRLAEKYPERFYKDADGHWHYVQMERRCAELGIPYRLRSAAEIPRRFFANSQFLEDYTLESCAPLDAAVRKKIRSLLAEKTRAFHLELIEQDGLTADEIFKAVVEGVAYVDLRETLLSNIEELVIYKNKAISDADALIKAQSSRKAASSALKIAAGSKFLFQNEQYEIILPGTTEVVVRDVNGVVTKLGISLIQSLFAAQDISGIAVQEEHDKFKVEPLFRESNLQVAVMKLNAIQNPTGSGIPDRTIRSWKSSIAGVESVQDQLAILARKNPGNTTSRLPIAVMKLAKAAVKLHNTKEKPTVAATYSRFVEMCCDAKLEPMSRAAFFKRIKREENVEDREGKRLAYQKAPIPLIYDYEHPVHGVQPHEVCYCDHTVLNIFVRGMELPELPKPTFTLMTDGALSMARAFCLSFSPPGTEAVFMCLRDYVRRQGRLPKILVLDNGKEFHSIALKAFCSVFSITIRWRRRSRPRDSSPVERAIGVTEQELIQQMEGNSIALKNPRMVSSTHHPQGSIRWTLPALHGAFEHFLFEVQAKRVHPRFGVSPVEREKRMILEMGARDHVMVRYDTKFRLLTAAHKQKPTRVIDRREGVFVEGRWYWHDNLALAKSKEEAEVRVERWNARIVYVCFREEWLIAQARDGGRLEGRFA